MSLVCVTPDMLTLPDHLISFHVIWLMNSSKFIWYDCT